MSDEDHVFAVAFQFGDGSLEVYSLISDSLAHAVGTAIDWLCHDLDESFSFEGNEGITKIAVEMQDDFDLESMMKERGWKKSGGQNGDD